ncbi:NUDIX hydrolase domain-like protein [Mycena maculata]|uniref:NUDIX hydrolase domain-like protein n=1 Tax=Mycena maculata TaxID=230809 RepID=A0AAD7I1B2_9AGAR|nr:NUDIX hydrolase domain-like protein [Mycena maculata]
MASQPKTLSYLDLVNICGNTRIGQRSPIPSAFDSEQLVPLRLSPGSNSPVIGLLRPQIVELLDTENERSLANGGDPIFGGVSTVPGLRTKISFHASIDTHSKRTAVMQEMCARWRDTGLFPDIIGLKKWRSEAYAVYRDPFGIHDYPGGSDAEADENLNFAFEIERAACALFGIVTYGVHMSMYQEVENAMGQKGLKIWIPTRASTKSMWPGYLDNTVAGGIPSGMPIFEALVKECMEEASLNEDLVRAHARSVGCVSYFFRTSKGWLQPEVEYTYDMAIPAGADPTPFEPKPLDGEVESFDFMDKAQVEAEMRAGRFKPNCAVVTIDLFIRLGYITPDNEPEYLKIVTALHTKFDYERW